MYTKKSTVSQVILHALALLVFLVGCTGNPPPGPAPTEPVSQSSPTATTALAASTPEPSPTETTPAEPTEAAPTEAPSTPMPTEPQASPTPSTPPTQPAATAQPEVTQQADCIDQATYVRDVTIPDGAFFESGESFTKTWRVKNSGTCTWHDGYALVFVGGDIMNGNLTNPIPVVPPGESADVSVDFDAPARFGLQTGYWMFQNAAGSRFGVGVPSTGQLWVQINVTWTTSAPTAAATPGAAAPTPVSGVCTPQENSGAANEILALINQARATNGLDALTLQNQLNAAALAHSTDMACNNYVDHNGSDGTTWYDRVAAQGYANYASARENIYVGDPAFGGTPQGAFDWWMNSQVHRDNILNPNVTQVGIGYVYLSGSKFGGYYTLVFARP